MSDPPLFGAELRRLRLAADLTQEALADAVGCAAETIRSFESGRRRPSRPMATRLAAVLGIAPADLPQFLARARAVPAAPASSLPAASVAPIDALLLLATKLRLPRLRADSVARPRLIARLNAVARPVILVAAPAGFGKTTLLTEWLLDLERRTQNVERTNPDQHKDASHSTALPLYRFAWLALDRGDSDPILFIRALVAALQTMAPQIGERVLHLLHNGQAPPLEVLLPALVIDMAQLPAHCILVLDDYHLIEAPAVHQILAFLVEHIPPQLQLVIASRVDPPLPLGRLRARGQISELRAADLRFTLEEATAFFEQLLACPPAPEDVQTLEARTEGWAVGLQLAALAMQQHTDSHAFVQRFAGSNRFVVDYLAEEVIERLPPHLNNFVLQTSILNQLSGPLCDFVLGMTDTALPSDDPQAAYSQLLLLELERANVFLVPLDDERRWYRYHHLFGEVVRARLRQGAPPAHIAELHARASAWYEQAGMDAEAIQHACAAAAWTRAANLLIRTIPQVVGRSQFHTGLRWLEALPDTAFHAHPTLFVYRAGVLMYLNRVPEAVAALDQADRAIAGDLPAGVSPADAQIIAGQSAVIRGALNRIQGDLAGCVAQSHRALELLPTPETTPLKLRPLAMLNASRAFLVTGDVSPTVEARAEAVLAPLRATGNLFALLASIINLARIRAAQGRLRPAMETYAQALTLVADPADLRALVGGAAYYIGLGDLLRETDDLAAAGPLLYTGLELIRSALTVDADTIAHGYIALARLEQAQGDLDGAQRTLGAFLNLGRERTIAAYLIDRGLAEQARLSMLQGDLVRAVHWADQRTPDLLHDRSYLREEETLNLVRVRIAQSQVYEDPALLDSLSDLIDTRLAAAEAAMRHHSSISFLVLRSLIHEAQGRPAAVAADRDHAYAQALPQGYRRIFRDEGISFVEPF
jgi:LuxR family transcriptional regulator, maltose regulon positive regulatory protein